MKQPPWTMCGGTGWGSAIVGTMKVLRRSSRKVQPFLVSVGVALLVVFAGPALAAPTSSDDPVGKDEVVETVNPYASSSDAQLTEHVADWDRLDSDQRRALLAEVKKRMARQGRNDGTLSVRLPRKYGTLRRRGTLRIQIRPIPRERQEFGVGFEQRSAQPDAQTASAPGESAMSAEALKEQALQEQALKDQALRKQAVPVLKVTDPN